jgi:hypothetical protein
MGSLLPAGSGRGFTLPLFLKFSQNHPVLRTMQAHRPSEEASSPILSPFSDAEQAVHPRRKKPLVLWISLGLAFFLIVALSGFFLFRYLNDPLRTLEPFPVSKYLDGYKSLAGSRFRADLRVENDLGWKEGIGRIMVFSVQGEPRSLVVMIPPDLAQIFFTKGQNYQGELEVKEGGLIYAHSIRKN